MTDQNTDTGNGEDESAEERSQYGGTEQKDLVGAEDEDDADADDESEEEDDAEASERTSEGEAEGQDVPGP